jgi:predicted DsbA family dithiol-disulfide isomerase
MSDNRVMTAEVDRHDTILEVFADITCPFTHVGLKRVIEHIASSGRRVAVLVRAWPLEWVNGAGLEVDAVEMKAKALSEQLGVNDFAGLEHDQWPSSTLPALGLAAAAYERDVDTGLAISLDLRTALFEQGRNIGDPEVLAQIAADHDLTVPDVSIPGIGVMALVQADFDEGRRRGVTGSPHFFIGQDNFFCPALDLGHDADGNLTARLDMVGLAAFFAHLDG